MAKSVCDHQSYRHQRMELWRDLNPSSDANRRDPNRGHLNCDFRDAGRAGWHAAHGWSNGPPFAVTWDEQCVSGTPAGLSFDIGRIDGQLCGGELRRDTFSGFGTFEASLKVTSVEGVVCGFFAYTGPADGTSHDEIDIEFVGGNRRVAQCNYWRDGVSAEPALVPLGFDTSERFHRYSFEWRPDRIFWSVDGRRVWETRSQVPRRPLRIILNAWVADRSLTNWAGDYREDMESQRDHVSGDASRKTVFECSWVRYTPAVLRGISGRWHGFRQAARLRTFK